MQSLENNKPTSPTKRLGVSLSVDTGYNGKVKDLSPPQTPTAQTSRARVNIAAENRAALKARTGHRETFLDDITPIDPSLQRENDPERGREHRDPHDLSLSPREITRDSLVDHMLLSLDQFSFGPDDAAIGRQPTVDEERLYSSFGDEESYLPSQNFAEPRNARGPGHAYSYSSDFENADDSSRQSDKLSRGRRSNSSSNFQSGLGRINSVRNDPNSTFARGLPPQNTTRGIHSRGGKGSKGSSANSFDLGYAQVTSSQRWAHGLAGRSSSFDYGSDRQSRAPNTMNPQINTAAANTFNTYNYDAAPTPTVPGGPRRFRPASPIIIPQPEPIPVEPSPQKLERKRSTRSSKSAYKSRNVNALSGGRMDYGLNDRSRELPPMPAFIKESSAPAPLVGYGKIKDSSHASPGLSQPPKDRPGFFRRVFGSSRNNNVTSIEPSPSHGSSTSNETADRPSSKPSHIASQIKSHYAPPPPPPREPPPPPKEHPHVLSKKPSSFFRRRKKSVSEPQAPVPLPIVPPTRLQPENDNAAPLPSPVSSLRKVMNPYLKSPGRSPLDPQHNIDRRMNDSPEGERHVKGFSPEYEPEKTATIRAIKPSSRGTGDGLSATYGPVQEQTLTSSSSPELPVGLHGQPEEERDATFLQDSSDIDPDAHSTASTPAPAKDASGTTWLSSSKPASSPSVARDIALVAEYERAHSKCSPTPARLDLAQSLPGVEPPRSALDSKSSQNKEAKDEGWIMLTPTKSPNQVDKDGRVWLEPSSSEEDLTMTNLSLLKTGVEALARTSGSIDTVYKSATSLPIVQIEGEEETRVLESSGRRLMTAAEAIKSLDELLPGGSSLIGEGDRERAMKIYDGNEDFIQKEKAAAWMGEEGPARSRTLIAYMELYDFSNLNILAALRNMCGRLVLKAESQQVDRILDAFAKRWCQCNPNHGFKVTDVVHTICYSILLLNTDLHLADIDQKMTRSQFVKNTMPTVRSSAAKAPDAFEPNRPSVLPGKSQAFGQELSAAQNNSSLKPERKSIEVERPSWRSSFKPPARADSDTGFGNPPTPLDYDTPVDDCGPLVKAPFHGTLRTWEVQVEIVLKDFYNSIRNERLPLFGATIEKPQLQAPSSNSLSVFANGMLRRTPSVISKSPSESQSYARGRTAETIRVGNGKFATKNRSRPRLYPNSGLGSSRTSLDDQSSMWSPSVSSSTWSKYSLGKTQTSMSVDSLGSSWPQGDYQQSIGFANALSQAIIREETVGSTGSGGSDELRVAPLLEDESLELAGAPWAKEGILKHKHHLEALDKKAKDRNWNEVFAVIEKGHMSLFSFSTKSMRNKSKGKTTHGVVGGGNWQDNAESLGSFPLRQTIASALPSPGYSKARPHVWALSLPTGAVHLFQVGTPDIVKEFVSTANYWSARLSNHPLVGGISNIEYGWSDAIVNNALVNAINESTSSRPSTSGPRPSMQSSLRSSLDQGHGGGHMRSRLPGDKVSISDWTPPTQSMRASNLMEPDQLKTLLAYVAGIEDELQKHNQLRSSMLLAFTPRHPNSQKAMANWEKKSSYLLREIVKFRTYIDCLHAAEVGKQRIYAERAARKAELEAGDDEDEGDDTLRLN